VTKQTRAYGPEPHASPPAVFPIFATALPHIDNGTVIDIFGESTNVAQLVARSSNAKIEHFFKFETAEAKAGRNRHDFEQIAATKERQDSRDAHALMLHQAKKCRENHECQQKHRGGVRAQKIADGWQPGQKCISLLIIQENIVYSLCVSP
jgi:hypothetical protein